MYVDELPALPTLLFPLNGSVGVTVNPRLDWDDCMNAKKYHVEVCSDSFFTSTVWTDSSLSLSMADVWSLGTGQRYYWRVRSENEVGMSDWSEVWSFFTGEGTTTDIMVRNGWNLLSVPLRVADPYCRVVYPSAISPPYDYVPAVGYANCDTLYCGHGYWLRFDHPETVYVTGMGRSVDTSDVVEGWNLIGALSSPLAVGDITSSPGGMITSQFFHYRGSYINVDSIRPGYGYWVKVNQTGKLIFSKTPSGSKSSVVDNKIVMKLLDYAPPPPPSTENYSNLKIPSDFELYQNYPNPFNPITSISYRLPSASYVTVKIYNLLGKELTTIVQERKEPGEYTARWDGSKYPTGLYFYRMTAGTFTGMKKLLLVK